MKTIFAVLVAIDQYQGAPKLRNAKKDMDAFHSFLVKHKGSSTKLNVKPLRDSQATKSNIIRSFDHFKRAGSDDVCLFYFAGHGSVVTQPPEELSHLEREFQSIVCYDSRGSGGFDLTDKELSYLIWNAVGNKHFSNNGHFIAIMDCCHAGDNTRDDEEAELVRTVAPAMSKDVSNYYGYRNTRGSYPPRASHIQLAACDSHEKAGDGVFTGHLIAALSNGMMPYRNLTNELCNRISGRTNKPQNPQLNAYPGNLGSIEFLGGCLR